VTVQRASSSGRPTFEGEQRSPVVRLFGLLNRRWVRVVAILLVVLLVVGTAYSKFVIEPQLTATRLTVRITGGGSLSWWAVAGDRGRDPSAD